MKRQLRVRGFDHFGIRLKSVITRKITFVSHQKSSVPGGTRRFENDKSSILRSKWSLTFAPKVISFERLFWNKKYSDFGQFSRDFTYVWHCMAIFVENSSKWAVRLDSKWNHCPNEWNSVEIDRTQQQNASWEAMGYTWNPATECQLRDYRLYLEPSNRIPVERLCAILGTHQ